MTALDVSVPFALGIVSSLHCTQMCGPIVLAYSMPMRSRRPVAHVAYNAGRIATYSLLGAIAGALGGGVSLLGKMAGIERGAALIAGCAMIAAAFLLSGKLPAQALVRIGSSPSWIARTASGLLKSDDAMSKLLLGSVLGFMPCGLIYAALLKSVDSGSALAGAISMAAFGAGTSGALLAIGIFSSSITSRFGRHANAFATASVALLGVFLLARGFGWAGHLMGGMTHEHHHAN